jgi:siroheme synthase-like protein
VIAGVPLLVELEGSRVVCVGAGPVAAAKVLPLADAGGIVRVIAPEACEPVRQAAAAGRLQWLDRPYRTGDLDATVLAFAATGHPRINAAVAADAAAQPVLCVRVDGGGTAALPAVVRRGPLTLAVSTGGRAPVLSRYLRQRLEAEYGPEWGEVATLMGELRTDERVRAALRGTDAPERRQRWREALQALLQDGRPVADRERALFALRARPAAPISSPQRPPPTAK